MWHKVLCDTQIKSMALVVGALSKNRKFTFIIMYACMLSHVRLLATLWTVGSSTRLLCPWDSPGKNTRVGCHSHPWPLQYSCLENPMDRGAWEATAFRVIRF